MRCNLTGDGTLDKVFECDTCGEEVRYSADGMERSEDENTDDLEEEATREHADECEGDGPQPEDYLMSDAREGISVAQHEGRHVGTYKTRGEAELAIRKHAGGGFFPNVWVVSDHGNAHLVEGFQWDVPTWSLSYTDPTSEEEDSEMVHAQCVLPTEDAARAEQETIGSLGGARVERDGCYVYVIASGDLGDISDELRENGRDNREGA